jgi:YteA family regulatory protein
MTLTNEQLHTLRQQLIEEKSRLEQRLSQNDQFGLSDGFSSLELAAYDNHPADVGTEVFERGKDIALNEQAEQQLAEVDEALRKMESGRYGLCSVCGQPIPYERLRAKPETEFCLDHVPDREKSERRPVEERLLAPPFGRTSLDEHPEQSQFDGEDAWQIVESWGNSDSPAMAEDRDVGDYDSVYIEADENEGFVEAYESFLATDLYGNDVTVVRNRQYKEYMENNEGMPLLEPDRSYEDADGEDWR